MKGKISIFWHRRDLRLEDNTGLYHAFQSEHPVLPLFIFDKNILDKLEDKKDKRVQFIHNHLSNLHTKLGDLGSSILVKYGNPLTVWKQLTEKFEIAEVYTNRDYEPYAQERDKAVYAFLQSQAIAFKGYKDQVIFEKNEVLKKDGKPYTVYTPYSRKWKERLAQFPVTPYPSQEHFDQLYQTNPLPMPSMKDIGFKAMEVDFPSEKFDAKIVKNYAETRDIPSIRGTSRLSVHLRFGTISIRALLLFAKDKNEKYLNELIWRDFYQTILYHFPHSVNKAFKPIYDSIPWINDETHFKAWCEGKTGYPLVDAGMRELNATGFMHNRVRMVVASFLTKHLLTDWRWGEAYFAKKLLDFDLASNVGGWQWAAGSGCDAAPYFRVFNPTSQLDKFDKQLVYVKQWVPEFGTTDYPQPIVEHKFARQRAIDTYKQALDKAKAALS